jgi:hypothetical protein
VVPGGIGQVYDKEYSYPMPNADIGMTPGSVDFGYWMGG